MLLLLVLVFVLSLPMAVFAAEGRGRPEVVGPELAAEKKAEAEARAAERKAEVEAKVAEKTASKTEEKAVLPAESPKEPSPVSLPATKPDPKPAPGGPLATDEKKDLVTVWVDINPDHLGTTADCAADWHFVLVGLGKGALPGTLTAVFEKAGEISVGPSKVLLQMQHFNIKLSEGDRLVEAYAQVELPEPRKQVRLNLSDVTCLEPPPPPPSEEPTCPPPPPSEKETPTVPPKPEEPVVPEPEAEPLVKSDPEPYLPYTGINGLLLLILTGLIGKAGLALRCLG